MNLLAVVGSPRPNGNTAILVSRIAEGARTGGADVDVVRLGSLVVQECDGCHACWRGRSCTKDDDMRRLYPSIGASDVILFATPVYWYGPTALMKAFIDRFVYFNCPENRPQIRGKRAAVALVLEEEIESTWRPVMDFFDKSLAYLEMTLAGTVVVPGVGKAGEIRQKRDRLDEAFRLGRALVQTA
ncbi:MAG: flavodoxin family protein [Sedimentisphaerales bacterium]|nr:flavodoxin family protein [Sedimentisphaerales bacterium]